MRVLQVLGSSAGGVARHVAQIAAALAADAPGGPALLLDAAGPADLADQVAPTGGRVLYHDIPLGDRPQLHDVDVVRRLRVLASRSDVVHAHGLRAGASAVIAVRSLRRDQRPRVVVTLHNLPVGGRSVRAVSAVLERTVVRGADVVLGVSGDLVERARRQGARRTARALVPAPDRPPVQRSAAEVRAELGLADHVALIVTVARLAPQKGLDLLCDSAALLRTRAETGELATFDDVVWAVAGDGPLRAHLESRSRSERLPVIVLGRRSDVPDLLAAADLVVSTAVWEGQPIWLQEALQLGAPIVATDVGGTGEVTGDGATLVPTADPAHLVGRMAHLLTDPARRAALAESALERARTLPTIDDVVAQLVQVYGPPGSRD